MNLIDTDAKEDYLLDGRFLIKAGADMVKVVRCKNCKDASPNGVYGCRLERFSEVDKSERLYAEDFCSLGEPKDG